MQGYRLSIDKHDKLKRNKIYATATYVCNQPPEAEPSYLHIQINSIKYFRIISDFKNKIR